MKLIILFLPVLLCGFINISLGQQNIQFIYIGSTPDNYQDVLISSATFQGDYIKGNDRRLTKIYYTNQRTLDSVKAYILRSSWVKRSDTSEREKSEVDTVKLIHAFKIVGVETYPLYVKGKDCSDLFISTMRHLIIVNLGNTSAYSAMDQLMVECNEKFWNRNSNPPQSQSNEGPYRRIEDTPRIKVNSNN
jgi:hypothetical protein